MEPENVKTIDDLKIALREHYNDDDRRFESITKTLDKQHGEVMAMLTPVYDAFNFRRQLSREQQANIVKWTKRLALVAAIFTVFSYIWKFIIVALMNTKQ